MMVEPQSSQLSDTDSRVTTATNMPLREIGNTSQSISRSNEEAQQW